MKVEITNRGASTFVDGTLQGVISEQDAPYPQIVIELVVAQVGPMRVTLNEIDLVTTVRLARNSTAQKIRDAVR